MSTTAKPPAGQRTVGPALEAMNRFLRWLIPTVEKFPRTQKFLLGDRIQGAAVFLADLDPEVLRLERRHWMAPTNPAAM